VYVTHVQEWRQQFSKVESVDLRYGGQIIVNPDLREMPRQPTLSPAAAKAAMSAGVKRAALVNYEKFAARPLASPAAKIQPKRAQPVASTVDAKAPAKNIGPSAVAVKTATPKPAVKAAKAPTHRVVAKAKRKAAAKKAPSKWAKAHSGKTIRPAASHAASGIAGQNSAASASTKKKPNPAIAKGQDHP
jgi:hypothetical protein